MTGGTRLHYDLAYCCFLFLAVGMLAYTAVMASFTKYQLANGAGAIVLVFLPCFGLAAVVLLVGIVLSICLWKHWPLAIIAVSSILGAANIFTVTPFHTAVRYFCGLGVVAISCLWFFVLRSRRFPPTNLISN